MHQTPFVTDALLRKLSGETQLVGQVVTMKDDNQPGSQALVLNVIILPHEPHYRLQFMNYYARYHQNAVKALKELIRSYPASTDYELGLGYVLSTNLHGKADVETPLIRTRKDFIIANDLAAYRQELLKYGLKH